jgi:glycosyltransferase involved in cell wall biosynthesis
MKIMLVSRVTPHHRPGGMPFVVQDRAEALAKAGHDVHVVTTHLAGKTVERVGSLVHFFDAESPSQKWSREFARACEEHWRCFQPDVLHLDSFDAEHPWWQDKRACITVHGFGWGAFLTKWNLWTKDPRVAIGLTPPPTFDAIRLGCEVKMLRCARVAIGVSKHEYRMLRDEYGLPQAKLVYNPIAEFFFFQDRSERDREYFVCAAVSGQQERGFGVARSAAIRAGVELRICERLPREQLPAVYDGAKALVLPTFYAQGFDLAVCEARARGCPAIVSATGSYLAEAGPWDTLIQPGDTDGLADALMKWGQQPVTPLADLMQSSADCHRPDRHVEEWLAATS